MASYPSLHDMMIHDIIPDSIKIHSISPFLSISTPELIDTSLVIGVLCTVDSRQKTVDTTVITCIIILGININIIWAEGHSISFE